MASSPERATTLVLIGRRGAIPGPDGLRARALREVARGGPHRRARDARLAERATLVLEDQPLSRRLRPRASSASRASRGFALSGARRRSDPSPVATRGGGHVRRARRERARARVVAADARAPARRGVPARWSAASANGAAERGATRCLAFRARDDARRSAVEATADEEEDDEPCASGASFSRDLLGAFAAAAVAGSLSASVAAPAPALAEPAAPLERERLAEEVRKDVLRFEAALNKDLRVIEREIQIDKELIERDVERVPITLEDFLRKEPPVLVGMLAIAVVNGAVGLFWALFFRETSAGPGGEFGKGVAALRKEVVKGILKFFGSIMGSYTQQDNRSR